MQVVHEEVEEGEGAVQWDRKTSGMFLVLNAFKFNPKAKECPDIKRVAGVIRLKNDKRICLVIEMISSNEDATSVAYGCQNLNITHKYKWSMFGKVAVDFSFAFMPY